MHMDLGNIGRSRRGLYSNRIAPGLFLRKRLSNVEDRNTVDAVRSLVGIAKGLGFVP